MQSCTHLQRSTATCRAAVPPPGATPQLRDAESNAPGHSIPATTGGSRSHSLIMTVAILIIVRPATRGARLALRRRPGVALSYY
jgi:hypothetical protein